MTLGRALADADDDETEADGDAETEGDGVGFGVAALVGVGVGPGFGAVTVKIADVECDACLYTNVPRTKCVPAPRWPLGGLRPDFVAVHVDLPTNDALPNETPSHENDAVGGHLPCAIVNVTRALNVCVAVA